MFGKLFHCWLPLGMYWYFSTRRVIDCIKQPLAPYWNVHFPSRVSAGQRQARSGLQRFEAPSSLPLWPQTLLLQMSLIYYFLLCVNLTSRTLLHPALPGNQYPLIGIVIWDDMQASCRECSTPWLTALRGVYPHRRHRGEKLWWVLAGPEDLAENYYHVPARTVFSFLFPHW